MKGIKVTLLVVFLVLVMESGAQQLFGPQRMLDGTINQCQGDCYSLDACVQGLLSCTTADGRTAKCKRCMCTHYYVVENQEGFYDEVECASPPTTGSRNNQINPIRPNTNVNSLPNNPNYPNYPSYYPSYPNYPSYYPNYPTYPNYPGNRWFNSMPGQNYFNRYNPYNSRSSNNYFPQRF